MYIYVGFDFVSEKGRDHIVRFYFDKDGNWDEDKNKGGESQWNMHVWTEVMLKRVDLGKEVSGWNILDGTWQAGPCAVDDFKNGDLTAARDCEKYEMSINSITVYCTVGSDGKWSDDDCDQDGAQAADSITTTLIDSPDCKREMSDDGGSYDAICMEQLVDSYKPRKGKRRGPTWRGKTSGSWLEMEAEADKRKTRGNPKRPRQQQQAAVAAAAGAGAGMGPNEAAVRALVNKNGVKTGVVQTVFRGVTFSIKRPGKVRLGKGMKFAYSVKAEGGNTVTVTKSVCKVYLRNDEERTHEAAFRSYKMPTSGGGGGGAGGGGVGQGKGEVTAEDWRAIVERKKNIGFFQIGCFTEFTGADGAVHSHYMRTRTSIQPHRLSVLCPRTNIMRGEDIGCQVHFVNPFVFETATHLSLQVAGMDDKAPAFEDSRVLKVGRNSFGAVKYPANKCGKAWVYATLVGAKLQGAIHGMAPIEVSCDDKHQQRGGPELTLRPPPKHFSGGSSATAKARNGNATPQKQQQVKKSSTQTQTKKKVKVKAQAQTQTKVKPGAGARRSKKRREQRRRRQK